jgi:hypothetical protein
MYSSFAATLGSRGEALNLYRKRAGGGFKCFLIPRRRMKYGKAMSASNIGRILPGTGLSAVLVMEAILSFVARSQSWPPTK